MVLLPHNLVGSHYHHDLLEGQALLCCSFSSMGILSLTKKERDNYILLDARELKEFELSHIKDAKHIGFKKLNEEEWDS